MSLFTLKDVVDSNVPGAETHDWQVWVKNPGNDKIENFLEKVVFMFTLKDPKRTVTRPPYNIQEAGYGSFKILIYTFSARVEYDLDRLYDLA